MTPRMKRLASDYEQVRKDFSGHKNIILAPMGEEPPEKYHITYFVNGIYLLPDGKIEMLNRHEVEITLHAEYPRYKPLCRIFTPIWHPNFRDGQICIGDIWGAGESLSDIIINIGDMIQYKSWNSYSPLSAEAAQWAMENKHLFPVGNMELRSADYASAKDQVDIDLFDDDDSVIPEEPLSEEVVKEINKDENPNKNTDAFADATKQDKAGNDFDITSDDLANIEFVPTMQRMQTVTHGDIVKGKSINFKTILTKGLLWALIGGIVGFILQEALDVITSSDSVLEWMGYSYYNLYDMAEWKALDIISTTMCISTGLFTMFIACSLGLFLGIGEGVFYGSKENAVKYAAIGAGISLVIGFISGYIAQIMYSSMLTDYTSDIMSSIIRGAAWSVMGLGVGLSIGFIKPTKRRILYCGIGGAVGGFIGGFIFNYIFWIFTTGEDDTGALSRAIGIIVMGLLIGLCIGLLEQVAKQAWLKVIRGEFEGKEYLVFAGTTSIGNNGKNTIVLFKDKLVGPNHCNIVLEGNKYVIIDKGTPMGTIVNGRRTIRHVLNKGDTIAIGNSVLVFNTK